MYQDGVQNDHVNAPSARLFRLDVIAEQAHHDFILDTLDANGLQASQWNPDGTERFEELYWGQRQYHGHISFHFEDDMWRSEDILSSIYFDGVCSLAFWAKLSLFRWYVDLFHSHDNLNYREVRNAARHLNERVVARDSAYEVPMPIHPPVYHQPAIPIPPPVHHHAPIHHHAPSHRAGLMWRSNVPGPSGYKVEQGDQVASHVAGPSRMKLEQDAGTVEGPSRVKVEHGGHASTEGGSLQVKVERDSVPVLGSSQVASGGQAGHSSVDGEDTEVKMEPYP